MGPFFIYLITKFRIGISMIPLSGAHLPVSGIHPRSSYDDRLELNSPFISNIPKLFLPPPAQLK